MNSINRFISGLPKGVLALVVIALVIVCVYPFYYVFIYSISIPMEVQGGGIYLLPAGFTLQGYVQLFKDSEIWNAAFISVSRTVLGTMVSVFCTSAFAFLLTQEKLKLRKFYYRLVVITMYVQAGLIPWYITMKSYGLRNNFMLYIIPGAILAFNLILIKTYMEQLPSELYEAAKVEGAGVMYLFFKIAFPLSRPIIATVTIFTAVSQWNQWMDNFFLADVPQLQTLQYLLLKYLVDQTSNLAAAGDNLDSLVIIEQTPMSIRMTITMIVTLPVLLIYPMFQKHFVKGIMVGAVKG